MDRWVERSVVLPVTVSTAKIFADLRRQTEQTGRPVPTNDLWIVACCVEAGEVLATRDSHQLAIAGVKVLRPF